MEKTLLNRMQEKTERHRIRRNAKRKFSRKHFWEPRRGYKFSPVAVAAENTTPRVSIANMLSNKLANLFRRKV